MRKTDWRQLSFSFKQDSSQDVISNNFEDLQNEGAVLSRAVDSGAEAELDAHRMRIQGYLTVYMPEPVKLVFTKNHSTMISFRRREGCIYLRLHKMFRHADENMLNHLLDFLKTKKNRDSSAINKFIADHSQEIDSNKSVRRSMLEVQGRYFNLEEVLARTAERYFGGQVDVSIGWGRAPNVRKRKGRFKTISRALATYSYNERIIRVSPILDAPDIPSYVIDWIVYHEILHHVIPVKKSGSKHIYHSAQFRSLERGFEHFEKAKKWETENIERILR